MLISASSDRLDDLHQLSAHVTFHSVSNKMNNCVVKLAVTCCFQALYYQPNHSDTQDHLLSGISGHML